MSGAYFYYIEQIADFIGILGVILVIGAFYLLQAGILTSLSFRYQYMNLTGAIFLLISLYFHWNLASVVIEFLWFIISIFGIIRINQQNKKNVNS